MDSLFPIPVLNNKSRCKHLAIHLECNVGGDATTDCFHPSFHEECKFKKKAERKYARFPSEEKTDESVHHDNQIIGE